MDPVLGYGLMKAGGGILEALGGNPEKDRAYRQMMRDRHGLMGLLGENIDPMQMAQFTRRGMADQLGGQANYMSKRGISGPLAQGAMFEGVNDVIAKLLGSNWLNVQQGNRQKDLNIWQALLGSSSAAYGGA